MSNKLVGYVYAPDAIHGKSAYEIAVAHGFDGTEEEWINYQITEAERKAQEIADKTLKDVETAKAAAMTEIDNRDRSLIANAIKKTATGNVVVLDDVSPFKHTIKVKAISDTADISTVNVFRCGGNMLDIEGREVVDFGGASSTTQRRFTGNGIIKGFAYNNYYAPDNVTSFEKHKNGFSFSNNGTQTSYGIGFDFKTTPNITYVVYFQDMTNRIFITEYDKDGNFLRYKSAPGIKHGARVYTTGENTEWIVISVQNESNNQSREYNDFYIGVDTFNGFEEFKEATTHSVNADGTVEGVTSLYPITTLIPDTEGVELEVAYNIDTNILTKTLPLIDRITGIPYYLYVSDGKLLIEEREG